VLDQLGRLLPEAGSTYAPDRGRRKGPPSSERRGILPCRCTETSDRTSKTMDLSFLGAAGTVTGSRYLVTTPQRTVLVDCGLFQGHKQRRRRNWMRFPVEPRSMDAVILTHAHLDHSGYLPVLVRDGFEGPIYCTAATADLCRMLLPDSARIEEEDARYANKHGFSKHRPALPLYTADDAARALERLVPVPDDVVHDLGAGLTFRYLAAGHILGASMVELRGPHAGIL